MSIERGDLDRRHTRLVCTLGPATRDLVGPLIDAGMDVARINFSHGTPEQRHTALTAVRDQAEERELPVAVLADLSGPKIRLGDLVAGEILLEAGQPFRLRPGGPPGDRTEVAVGYGGLATDLQPGDHVLLADGAAELRVLACTNGTVETEIVRGGPVRSRAGVNVPSDRLSLPAITDKDLRDLDSALTWGVDFVAQSFVRRANDVVTLRRHLEGTAVRVMAKIETRAAVEDFDAICEEADAVMLARGDLGVEMAFEEIPVIQKDLVHRAVTAGVPVVVATQMLESMVSAPRPTRAEASDVANAVLDGADALLLSAETAIGAHPVDAARTAGRIATLAEREGRAYLPVGQRRPPASEPQAIAQAAVALVASDPRIATIACFTRTGRTAELLSATRPGVGIVAFSPDETVARTLSIRRGVTAHPSQVPADTDSMIGLMDEGLRRLHGVATGTLVIVVASTPVGRSNTNLLKIHRVGESDREPNGPPRG